jgi:DNA-binding transcriptional LysR family regulator
LHDTSISYADDCIAGLPERRFREAHDAGARMRTWPAWQEEPGKPFGTAITARYLDAHAPPAKALVDWMRRLFAPDG